MATTTTCAGCHLVLFASVARAPPQVMRNSGKVFSGAAGRGTVKLSGAEPVVSLAPSAAASSSWRAASTSSKRNGGLIRRERVLPNSQFLGLAVLLNLPSSSGMRKLPVRIPALSARSALVQKVTAKELDDILTNERTSPMIIDFYATWCGPCIVLAQELETLAMEYGGDVRFLKVDTDEEHELASQMEIRGLPTIVFVSKDVDKLAIRTEGLLPRSAIRDIIDKEL